MVLLVEVSVVLVRLPVEHLVEVATRIHFWRFIRWRELLNGDAQCLYRIVQPEQQLSIWFCSWYVTDALFLFRHLELWPLIAGRSRSSFKPSKNSALPHGTDVGVYVPVFGGKVCGG